MRNEMQEKKHCQSDNNGSGEEFLNAVSSRKSRMTALLLINDQKVRLLVDMGADANILGKMYVKRNLTKKTTDPDSVEQDRIDNRGGSYNQIRQPKNSRRKTGTLHNWWKCLWMFPEHENFPGTRPHYSRGKELYCGARGE